MQSVIERRNNLNAVLSKGGAHELYAQEDFELGCDNPKLVVFAPYMGESKQSKNLYTGVCAQFGENVTCSITNNPHSLSLWDLKIVWRDGVWYV